MVVGVPPASANNPPAVPPIEGGVTPQGTESAPSGCVGSAPGGSVRSGTDVYGLCQQASSQAPTATAAAAIRYGFAKLGTPYSQDPTLRTTSHFDCSSFVGRAVTAGGGTIRRYNGSTVDFFPYFGWTGAYVPVAYYSGGYRYGYEGTNLVRLPGSSALVPGDIIIQFNGPDPAQSAGNAGHALMYLGQGKVIQAGRAYDGVSKVSVVDYGNNGFSNQWYFRYSALGAAAPVDTSVPASGVRTVATGVANAAVFGTLAVVDPRAAGYATAYPCADGRPAAATTNYAPGITTSAFVASRSDGNGNICIFTSAGAHLVFDQVMASSVMAMHNAARKADTRQSGPIAGGSVARIPAGAPGKTVVGHLTATQATGPGFLTAFPCDAPRPWVSALNYAAGGTVTNAAVVRADAAGDICVFASTTTHVIWDQASETTTLPFPSPSRRLDTRVASGGGAPMPGGTVRLVNTGSPGQTVLANLTAVAPESGGYLTVYPCDVARPNASSVNFMAGQTVSTFAAVRADAGGDVCIFASSTTHILWDQVANTGSYVAEVPVRKLDTRA